MEKDPVSFLHLTKEPAGSATTGFNPESQILQVELPILGLAKEEHPGGVLIRTAFEKMTGIE